MEREFLAVALIFPLPTESPTSSPISWFPFIWPDDTDLAAFQDLREAPSNGRNCCQFLVAFHFMGLWYRGLVRPTRVFIRKILTSVKSLPRYRRNVKSNQNQAFRIVQDWVLLCTGLYLEFMAFLLWHVLVWFPNWRIGNQNVRPWFLIGVSASPTCSMFGILGHSFLPSGVYHNHCARQNQICGSNIMPSWGDSAKQKDKKN